MTPFEGPDQITIGHGQGLNINSLGVASFSSPLSNLLFGPSITKNLISVSQFCKDNNVFFEFHSSFCLVKSQDSKHVLLKGLVGSDGLYQLPQLLLFVPKYKLPTNDFESFTGVVQSPLVNMSSKSDFQSFFL